MLQIRIAVTNAPQRSETLSILRHATNSPLSELKNSLGTERPVFVLDYSTFDLEEAIAQTRKLVADLQHVGAELRIMYVADDESPGDELTPEIMNNVLTRWTERQEHD